MERLPVHIVFTFPRRGAKWVVPEGHVKIHIGSVVRVIPEQSRLWEGWSRHWTCVWELHHVRRELKTGEAEWRLAETALSRHWLSLRTRDDGDRCGDSAATLLQPARSCIPRGRRGLHLRSIHAERSGPSHCLTSNNTTGVIYRLGVWRGRQPPRRLDWRQREVGRSEVIDMEVWVIGRADLEAVRRGRPVYRRGDCEGRRLGRRLLPIDSWSGPGVEKVRVRERVGPGRLQRRVRGGGLRCGGGTGKVPVWGSDETVPR